MNHHLVIFKKVYVDLIRSGRKTVECRFSVYRRPPFQGVAHGDTPLLKQSGGAVLAITRVACLRFIHPVNPAKTQKIRRELGNAVQADAAFFRRHRLAR
jgi:hypothetical protein